MKIFFVIFLLPLAVLARKNINDMDIACNADTRPAVLDGNEPWILGVYDFPFQNQSYDPNMLCEWRVEMGPGPDIVELKFLAFEVEDCLDCKCDSVSVFDGPDDSGQLLGTFCGLESIPGSVFSSGNTMFIRFESDQSFEYRGFMARYGPIFEEIACDPDQSPEIVTAESGAFFSPNWPELYPIGISCTWQFQAPPQHHIRFTFLDFELDARCSFPTGDRLDIFNGPTILSPRMIRMFGGNVQPHIIQSSSNTVLAQFITSLGLRFRGFFATWEFIDND